MAIEGVMIRQGFLTANTDFSNTAGQQGPSSSAQFLAVKINANSALTVDLCTSGAFAYGIIQNKPKQLQAADICTFGVTKAVAGAAITAGNSLKSDASGRMIPNTTPSASSAIYSVGISLETVTATGTVFSMDVRNII